MKTQDHRRTAAAAALVSAHLAPLAPLGVLVMAGVAWATGGGAASCDADNDPDWKAIDSHIPRVGGRKVFGHRMLLHWPGIALAGLALWHFQPIVSPEWPVWVFRGLWIAWLMHPAMDAVFGDRGIPWVLWLCHWGLELKEDGLIARVTSWAAVALSAYATFTLIPPFRAWWLLWT